MEVTSLAHLIIILYYFSFFLSPPLKVLLTYILPNFSRL
ncbi:hypothetical protein NT05LI_2108 [Listeria ivanovii FSL F6-596]|nr:hypothetical protein NT05LI_2108 [Listeria ivanovii FSL F6-596]